MICASYGLDRVPCLKRMLKPPPPVPPNGTVVGDRALKEVLIQCDWYYQKRRNVDTHGHVRDAHAQGEDHEGPQRGGGRL